MEGGEVVVIDFENGSALPEDLSTVEIALQSGGVRTTPPVLQRNPETNGPRLAFTFYPEEARAVEFRAQLLLKKTPVSEVWLYRWTTP